MIEKVTELIASALYLSICLGEKMGIKSGTIIWFGSKIFNDNGSDFEMCDNFYFIESIEGIKVLHNFMNAKNNHELVSDRLMAQ